MKFRPEVDNVYYQVWERVTLEKLMSKSDENYQKQVHLKLMNVVRQLYLNLGGGNEQNLLNSLGMLCTALW